MIEMAFYSFAIFTAPISFHLRFKAVHFFCLVPAEQGLFLYDMTELCEQTNYCRMLAYKTCEHAYLLLIKISYVVESFVFDIVQTAWGVLSSYTQARFSFLVLTLIIQTVDLYEPYESVSI